MDIVVIPNRKLEHRASPTFSVQMDNPIGIPVVPSPYSTVIQDEPNSVTGTITLINQWYVSMSLPAIDLGWFLHALNGYVCDEGKTE